MNIGDVISTLKAEKSLGKTPCGRPITERAKDALDAAISDEKNYGAPAIKCLNCNIILSSLLVPEGCVNCGGKDLTADITENDIL
jgi:hypothetical protein